MVSILFKAGDQVVNSFGTLIYISQEKNKKRSKGLWLCFCGKEFYSNNSYIKINLVKTCGCSRLDLTKYEIYLHTLWKKILDKCYNKNSKDYKDYGGRGISINELWKNNFDLFYNEIISSIGHRPTNDYQLDRIDNSLGYKIDNVRWATSKENNRNRRNNVFATINCETKTIAEWSEISGIKASIIFYRIKNEWPGNELLSPVKVQNKRDNLYPTFSGLRARCLNEKNKGYPNYGGRGIKLYEPWINNFKLFEEYILTNLGPKPDDTHLDRINNSGNYEPGNLKWSTFKENSRNKRTNKLIKINNEIKTLSEWVEISKISRATILFRIKNGWPDNLILRPSINRKCDHEMVKLIREKYIINNNIDAISKELNIRWVIISDIIKHRKAYKNV